MGIYYVQYSDELMQDIGSRVWGVGGCYMQWEDAMEWALLGTLR